MSTKTESPGTTGNWRTPLDELCTRLGFPLTTKTGCVVMPAPKRPLPAKKSTTGGIPETNDKNIPEEKV